MLENAVTHIDLLEHNKTIETNLFLKHDFIDANEINISKKHKGIFGFYLFKKIGSSPMILVKHFLNKKVIDIFWIPLNFNYYDYMRYNHNHKFKTNLAFHVVSTIKFRSKDMLGGDLHKTTMEVLSGPDMDKDVKEKIIFNIDLF